MYILTAEHLLNGDHLRLAAFSLKSTVDAVIERINEVAGGQGYAYYDGQPIHVTSLATEYVAEWRDDLLQKEAKDALPSRSGWTY